MVYKFSRTAALNSTADSTINWAEGQAPSSVNDSARAEMARIAQYRDDIAGAIVTTGTSTAYACSSYQTLSSLTAFDGQMIAFTPHTTNGDTVTLSVDGSTPAPLRTSTGTELLANTLLAGTPYTATWNNSAFVWYLHGFYGNPYNVPLSGGMIYFGATVPNSLFAFPLGQAISRTTYATLFSLIGTTHGVGDGSTTFNIPNLAGRVPAMREASASLLTASFFGGDSTALGATGGLQSHTLTTAQLAATTPAGTISYTPAGAISYTPAGTISYTPAGTVSTFTPSGTISVDTSLATTSIPVANLTSVGGATDTNRLSLKNNANTDAGNMNRSLGGSISSTFTGASVTPTFTGSALNPPTFTGSALNPPTFTGSALNPPTFTGTSFGSGQAHNNVQPTMICNYIIRII